MELEGLPREAYLEGQSKWPSVRLEFSEFAAHYARSLARSMGPGAANAAGLYLCCACARGEAAAVAAFAEHCRETARNAIARVYKDPDFVQETLQEVWNKLLVGPPPKVADYCGRGPLQAWVRVAAMRVALDRCRARQLLSHQQAELNDKLVSGALSPDLSLLRQRYAPLFQEALRRAVAKLSTQERNVLRMHVAGQCNIEEIGRAYNVHRATAARWLERSRSRIYEGMRKELAAERARLTESEFKSLARGIASELSLGLASHTEISAALSLP